MIIATRLRWIVWTSFGLFLLLWLTLVVSGVLLTFLTLVVSTVLLALLALLAAIC